MLKKRLLEGLALIISVLLFLGFWACGFFIQKDLNLEEIFGNWGALVACVLLIILAIANVKRGSNMRKQFSAGSLSKRY